VEVEDVLQMATQDNTLTIVRPGYEDMHMKFNRIVPGGSSQ